MHLEAEVYGLVLAGFGVVALCTLLALVYLFWRSRHRAILWFGGQLFCLTGAFWFFFRALCFPYDPQFAMYSDTFPGLSMQEVIRAAINSTG